METHKQPRFTVYLNLKLRNNFKAAAAKNNVTMNEAILEVMKAYVEETDKAID